MSSEPLFEIDGLGVYPPVVAVLAGDTASTDGRDIRENGIIITSWVKGMIRRNNRAAEIFEQVISEQNYKGPDGCLFCGGAKSEGKIVHNREVCTIGKMVDWLEGD